MKRGGKKNNMNKFFDWIKKNPKKTIGISIGGIVFIVFVIPIIITICFKFPAPCELLNPAWESSDVLSYYSGILGFLGSISLSSLALYQNYEIKKASDEKQAILEKIEHEKDMPLFRVKFAGCSGNLENLYFEIMNISDNLAYDLDIGEFSVETAEGECICKSKKPSVKRKDMFGKTENTIDFVNDSFSGENLKFRFQIKCKDKFKESHTYVVSSNIKDAREIWNEYKITEI